MRLHWHPFSIFPRRVRVALREKGLAVEEIEVDLPGGALHTAAFRRLNPFAQVPVLEDAGLVVFESLAILEYIEERYPTPPLLPRDLGVRAQTRALMLASGDYFAGPLKRWLARLFTPESTWDRADQERAKGELAAHLDVLETTLAGQEHLVERFSLADVAYVPFVCDLVLCQLGDLLTDRPNVRAWVDRLNARPSVAATRPVLG